jgi:hypothetical protein
VRAVVFLCAAAFTIPLAAADAVRDKRSDRSAHHGDASSKEWHFERVAGLAKGGAVLGNGVEGMFDACWTACPTVVATGGLHRMWYSSWYTPDLGQTGIGLATSVDGVNWKRANEGRPVLTPGAVGAFDSACVMGPEVHFDGKRYLLWYTGCTDMKHASGFYSYRIGVASSSDGVSWTRENGGKPVI